MRRTIILLLAVVLSCGKSEALPEYYSPNPPILLQGAMNEETALMISTLTESSDITIGHWRYVAGKIEGYPVVVNVTQCGAANSSASTALAIETFRPCAVINQGTAGAHDPKLSRGDIVIGLDCVNLSAWKSEDSDKGRGVDYRALTLQPVNFYDVYTFPETQSRDSSPFLAPDEKLLSSARAVTGKYSVGRVVEGRIGSYDSWENREDMILFLHGKFGTSCEEMETFHVADVCRIYGVPFLGVRVISNSTLKDQGFQGETGHECQKFVIEIVKDYINGMKK